MALRHGFFSTFSRTADTAPFARPLIRFGNSRRAVVAKLALRESGVKRGALPQWPQSERASLNSQQDVMACKGVPDGR